LDVDKIIAYGINGGMVQAGVNGKT
jgi:hypothetical protein